MIQRMLGYLGLGGVGGLRAAAGRESRVSAASRSVGRPTSRSLENPSTSLSDPSDEVWDAMVGGDGSSTGISVTPRKALGLSPVWRGVFLIANTVAKIPLVVYRRSEDGEGKEYASEHPAYRLLRRRPNPEMGAFTFRQVMVAQAILMGNAYAWIDRRRDGTPVGLYPLKAGTVEPIRTNGQLWFAYMPGEGGGGGGRAAKLPAEDVFRIRGPGLDALAGGEKLTKVARDSLGGGIASQVYAAKWFANGAEPRVIFESEKVLTPEQRNQVKALWQSMHAGLDNAHKSGITENGVKIKAFGVDPEKSQMIETRKFSLVDIANWLNLPPHKVGDSTRTGYNSLEQENQSFADDSVDPWLVQIEEEAYEKLLTEEEKAEERYTVEFMRQALMRVDAAARGGFYKALFEIGAINHDEIRARENLNPLPDGKGKAFYRPLNMAPVGGEEDEKLVGFLRDSWLGFQADGTVSDVAANLTDMKALAVAVGLPVNEEYTEPYLPVVADAGPLVSGGTVKDGDGDVVGGDVVDSDGIAPAQGQGEGVRSLVRSMARAELRRRRAVQESTRQVLVDVVRRMVGRVRVQAEKAARTEAGMVEFLGLALDEQRPVMEEAMGPAVRAVMAAWGRADAKLAERMTGQLVDGLLAEVRKRIRESDASPAGVGAALQTDVLGSPPARRVSGRLED